MGKHLLTAQDLNELEFNGIHPDEFVSNPQKYENWDNQGGFTPHISDMVKRYKEQKSADDRNAHQAQNRSQEIATQKRNEIEEANKKKVARGEVPLAPPRERIKVKAALNEPGSDEHPEYIPTQPKYVQQLHKGILDAEVNEANQEYEPYLHQRHAYNPGAKKELDALDLALSPQQKRDEALREHWEGLGNRKSLNRFDTDIKKTLGKSGKKFDVKGYKRDLHHKIQSTEGRIENYQKNVSDREYEQRNKRNAAMIAEHERRQAVADKKQKTLEDYSKGPHKPYEQVGAIKNVLQKEVDHYQKQAKGAERPIEGPLPRPEAPSDLQNALKDYQQKYNNPPDKNKDRQYKELKYAKEFSDNPHTKQMFADEKAALEEHLQEEYPNFKLRHATPASAQGFNGPIEKSWQDRRDKAFKELQRDQNARKFGLYEKGQAAGERKIERKLGGHKARFHALQDFEGQKMSALKGTRELDSFERKDRLGLYHEKQKDLLREQGEQQAKLDVGFQEHNERKNYDKRNRERLLGMGTGSAALSHHNVGADNPYDASKYYNPTSHHSIFGAALTGMGAHGLNRAHHKKGGSLRRYFAEGGNTDMANAMSNAFENHIDPLQSLKNIEYQKLLTQVMKQKILHRKFMKSGGDIGVYGQTPIHRRSEEPYLGAIQTAKKEERGSPISSPIAEGSRLARDHALHDKLMKHAEELERPQEDHVMGGYGDAIAAALASMPKDNYGKRFGMAYQAGSKPHKDKKEHDEKRKEKAVEIQQKLAEKAMKQAEHEEEMAFRYANLAEQGQFHKDSTAFHRESHAEDRAHREAQLEEQRRYHQHQIDTLNGKPNVDREKNLVKDIDKRASVEPGLIESWTGSGKAAAKEKALKQKELIRQGMTAEEAIDAVERGQTSVSEPMGFASYLEQKKKEAIKDAQEHPRVERVTDNGLEEVRYE